MIKLYSKPLLVPLFLFLGLAACGGGSSSEDPNTSTPNSNANSEVISDDTGLSSDDSASSMSGYKLPRAITVIQTQE